MNDVKHQQPTSNIPIINFQKKLKLMMMAKEVGLATIIFSCAQFAGQLDSNNPVGEFYLTTNSHGKYLQLIFSIVLSYLDPKCLKVCSQTCACWRKLIFNTKSLNESK